MEKYLQADCESKGKQGFCKIDKIASPLEAIPRLVTFFGGTGKGVAGRGMAWWTDILFLKKDFGEKQESENGESIFASLMRAVRRAFYDNFVDTLHHALVVVTYAYLLTNIVVFFFQQSLPASFGWLISAFSEPYLGALGIYVVVNEIRRHRGRKVYPHFGTVATLSWFALLIVSSALV